jgi:hypothetical protein
MVFQQDEGNSEQVDGGIFKYCARYPSSTEVKAIRLDDWPLSKGMWDNACGRKALVGDAAHAMTMCRSSQSRTPKLTQPYQGSFCSTCFKQANGSKVRGEAANHDIADVVPLCRELFDNAQ